MARLGPLWQQAGSYPATVDRRLLGALWPTGGVTGMAVTAAGASMNLNIAIGAAAVPDATVTGAAYLCPSDAVESVTLAAAPPSGQDRIDVVTVQPREGANNDWIVNVVQGTPAASPVAPTVPAGQLALAQVRVTGGSASVSQAQITDLRVMLAGVPQAPLGAGAPLTSYTDSAGEVWIARGGVNGGVFRKARDVLHSRGFRAAALSLPAGTLNIGIDGVSPGRDPYGLLNTSTGVFTVPVAGFYLTVSRLNVVSPSAGQWVGHYISINGASSILAFIAPGMAVQQGWSLPYVVRCAAGDTLGMSYNGNAVQTLQNGDTSTWMEVHYMGSG